MASVVEVKTVKPVITDVTVKLTKAEVSDILVAYKSYWGGGYGAGSVYNTLKKLIDSDNPQSLVAPAAPVF